MTLFEIERLDFNPDAVKRWSDRDTRNTNWPVVYVLDAAAVPGPGGGELLRAVYVGESLNAAARMRQHLASIDKKNLKTIRVIIHNRFNKSVCLDLESYLIRLLAGDGANQVLNRNEGITDADYYERSLYRETFREVFEQLKDEGMFTRSIAAIENSDLFKLSPFKALTHDQAIAVEDILEGLFGDLESGISSTIVIQGSPGTGKTVVAIYLLKLLADIANSIPGEEYDSDSLFSEFFVKGYPELLSDFRMGIVVPQQSLRASTKKVFSKTPGLSHVQVLTPFEVGESSEKFDLLVVDETHRLNQRANQPSASQNTRFSEITTRLFGADDTTKTQLDWIKARSRHQIFLLDADQSVRPADLPRELLESLSSAALVARRHYRLATQMRVQAGADYVDYIRSILSPDSVNSGAAAPPSSQSFTGYEFRYFDSLSEMRREILVKDAEHGLARLVAGYAWEWRSKGKPDAYDIEIDDLRLRWNSTQRDWIASPRALDEVGSIHTVQGYDLNYAGVIIGPDLRYDLVKRRLYIDRASYFDKKGKENSPSLGRKYSDADLLRFITNIYGVLLTRGIRGTYVYVCDPGLRQYLREFIPG